jgi:hypothetical protein
VVILSWEKMTQSEKQVRSELQVHAAQVNWIIMAIKLHVNRYACTYVNVGLVRVARFMGSLKEDKEG